MRKAIINKMRIISAAIAVALLGLSYAPVYAAALSSVEDTLTRLKNSSGSTVYADHTVSFTLDGATTLNAGETIVIDLDDDFGITGFATSEVEDFDITVGGTEESIVAAAGCASNDAIEITTVSGANKSFTFTTCSSYTAGAAGAEIIVEIGTNASSGGTGNDQISNPTASQTAIIDITAAGDTGKIAVAIIDDDQIPIQASVDPSITFTVENTALNLGILSSSSVSVPSGNTESDITIGTNASGGYTISVKGQGSGSGDGLYKSTAPAKLIDSVSGLLSVGTEGYGGQCQEESGPSGGCNATYEYWATDNVGSLALAYATFASHNAKPATTDNFNFRVKAAISTSTDAGSYADIITLIGTANF